MDESRWLDVRRVFEAVVDLSPDRRRARLEEECRGDAALLRQVARLLEADGAHQHLLDGAGVLDLLEPEQTREAAPPARIGVYRILEEVGRGGMGIVYRAVRADGLFDRAVAVKLVRGGFDSADVTTRFQEERRILANLEHPNVARLYDAGLAEDGRPYLVMEFVDGEPIDRYCDRNRLDVAARMELFRAVCEAVQYAHRNLVIHRDLKPSNILVDTQGAVRLLDFGIAKLVEPDHVEATSTPTASRPLTPAYASPEQIRGEALTTGSDVYSLGVILYELLTGRRPFEDWIQSVAYALGTDGDTRPQSPSRAVTRPATGPNRGEHERAGGPRELGLRRATTSDRLSRILAGDLDRILLKALGREPAERYSSVEALVDDLDRYRRGLPVRARTPALGYRARKFLRRHRTGVAAVAAVLLVLVSAAAFTVRESRVAREERSVAVGISRFLEALFEASDPRVLQVQDTTPMIDFLDASADRVRTELEREPRTRARMLLVLGRTYSNMGRSDRAEPLLRDAIDANRAVHGDRHEHIAEAQRLLGLLLADQDRFDEAASTLEDALATQRSLSGEQSWQVARLREALGQAFLRAGRPTQAVPHVEAALAIRREVLPPDDPVIANSLNTLAALKSRLGNDREAIILYEEAIEASLRSTGAIPEDIGVQRMNLASVLMRSGRSAEALDHAREGHRILNQNIRPWLAASSRGRLAEAVAGVWRESRSERAAAEVDSLFRSAIAEMRTLPEAARVRFTLHAHARFLQERGDVDAAESAMREVLALSTAAVGASHPQSRGIQANLASILLDAGRAAEAEPLARDAHEAVVSVLPAEHRTVVHATTTRARVLLALGRPAEAAQLLSAAHGPARAALGPEHPLIRAQREALSEARAALGGVGEGSLPVRP